MQRFTISLDDQLARQFDDFIGERGYGNRSEAVRDLIRGQIGASSMKMNRAKWCVASISYVYDHHDRTATERVSEFGSTPCKAHYRCTACLEPFDYFKCI